MRNPEGWGMVAERGQGQHGKLAGGRPGAGGIFFCSNTSVAQTAAAEASRPRDSALEHRSAFCPHMHSIELDFNTRE